jgi:lysozyme
MITDIYSQLRRDENTILHVYPDPRGFDTIGTGHNLVANPLPFDVSRGITQTQSDQILYADVARITARLLADIPWLATLQNNDVPRFGVFQNMAFNMGDGGILEFHHDLADTKAGNYAQAAIDMAASLWYIQVGARAQRLCQQMSTGQWV